MINHQHKFIFIHIPKTGGTSVEMLFDRHNNELFGFEDINGNHIENKKGIQMMLQDKSLHLKCLQHLTAVEIRDKYGEEIWNTYYKFTIVRNPWDLEVSKFTYFKTYRPDICERLGITSQPSFHKYVLNQNGPIQLNFITDELNNIMVNNIIRFENIQHGFDNVCKEIGIKPTQLPHELKSVRTHYRDYYNERTRRHVETIYSEDINNFEYTY